MTPHRFRRAAAAVLALVALTSAATACGDDDDGEQAEETTTTAPEAEATSEIEVAGAWARTSPAMATAGAAYFELTNTGDADDALVAAAVDPGVAATAEVHETVAADEGMGDDGEMGGEMGDSGGMMTMKEVERVPVPAGETVAFEPGGYHVMLLQLAAPLATGTTIELTLTFESGAEVEVAAEVRDMAP